MKMKTMLLGLTLILFPLPLQARNVYITMVGQGVIGGLPNLASVDVVIETNSVGFNGVFQTPHTIIGANQVIAMKGGVSSITRILQAYPRYIVTAVPPGCCSLGLYVCKVPNRLRKNVTYVFIHDTTFDIAPCHNETTHSPTIKISDVLAALATLPRRRR